MKISEIKLNKKNPRLIKDYKFEKLKKSITEFPKMLELRPIIIDNENIILGGNMRYQALKDLGYKELPDNWVKKSSELSEEEKQRFIMVDNISYGDFDWDIIANEWDTEILADWGLDVPSFEVQLLDNEIEEEEKDNSLKITDDNSSIFQIILRHDNKLILLETLNKVKKNYYFETQEDALMEILRIYNK